MKNFFSIVLVLLLNTLYSQSSETSFQMRTTNSDGEYLKYSEISGTPYLDKNFVVGKAACCSETMPMRYDIYANQIEYKKDDKVYILLKEEPYSKIFFKDSGTTFVLADIDKNGTPIYLVLLNEGKEASLLKKLGVKIETSKGGGNGLSGRKGESSSFVLTAPVYYLKIKDNYHPIKSLKDISDLFPQKTESNSSYLKANKVKFNREESLIKFISFLNGNL
ncbi:hypothetical protein LPB90_10285 [Chryseobacterium sp. LC2016-29]|uniref:hypothetical protein n=1 Tax=Chryseobacterium sp. LC2016-29 TaxID=2897331 RepID=UPI001E64D3EF|nr:hypothetical protein [Chryseobacterium sp. LC2016-29]MCD0478849.1 hypothetical protein [Chryseobacterium sp. LC2016-29]